MLGPQAAAAADPFLALQRLDNYYLQTSCHLSPSTFADRVAFGLGFGGASLYSRDLLYMV